MPEHKMVTLDGIRYRDGDAPKHRRSVSAPAASSDREPAEQSAPAGKPAGAGRGRSGKGRSDGGGNGS